MLGSDNRILPYTALWGREGHIHHSSGPQDMANTHDCHEDLRIETQGQTNSLVNVLWVLLDDNEITKCSSYVSV